MPIDYLTLMLINVVAGLVLLAYYVWSGLDNPNPRRWVAPFAAVGLVALVTGFMVTLTWPLPGSYNIPYGEFSVYIGVLFAAAAISIACGWDLLLLGVYAFFAGIAGVLMGVRFIGLGLSQQPIVAGVGFILTGIAGVFSLPALYFRHSTILRVLGVLVLLAAAVLWAVTGYVAYWQHMADFARWVPLTAR